MMTVTSSVAEPGGSGPGVGAGAVKNTRGEAVGVSSSSSRKMSAAAAYGGSSHSLLMQMQRSQSRERGMGSIGDEFDLTRSPSHFTPHSYEMNSKRVRSGSISGRLRSASDLEEKGIIDKTQMGALKDKIISGDESSIAALDKLAEGDRRDLEALLMSGALNQPSSLDLDVLVTGLVEEVDELDVNASTEDDYNGGATERAARGGGGDDYAQQQQQFEIEIGDLPFETSFADDGLFVGSADAVPGVLGGVSPSVSSLCLTGISPTDSSNLMMMTPTLSSFVIIKEEEEGEVEEEEGRRGGEEGPTARRGDGGQGQGEEYPGEEEEDLQVLTDQFWEETGASSRRSSMCGSSLGGGDDVLMMVKPELGVGGGIKMEPPSLDYPSAKSSASINIPRPNMRPASSGTVTTTTTTATTTTTTSAAGRGGRPPQQPQYGAGLSHHVNGSNRAASMMTHHHHHHGGGVKKEGGTAPVTISNRVVVVPRQHCGNVGAYSPESRRRRIEKFWDKKKNRIWQRKVKYDVRKNFADSRVRVKGRFVKKEDEALLVEINTLANKEGISELALLDLEGP